MKILHVIFSMNTGGAELMLVDIMRHQQLLNHDVSLLIINDDYTTDVLSLIPQKIKIYKLGRPVGSRNPLWLLRMSKLVSKISPQILHFHSVDAVKMMLYRPKNITYVGTIHNTKLNAKQYRKIDQAFAITKAVKDDTSFRCGVDSMVIYNGIEITDISFDENQIHSLTPCKLVQVGRVFCKNKGQDILIKAISLLKKDGYNVTIDFIGLPIDKKQLVELSQRLKVENNINFIGIRSREYIYSHLKDYDILVQPSRIEGFGLTLVEGMAAKLPVIASDIEGPAEILDNDNYGTLFNKESAEDCARAIKEVINNYPKYLALAQNQAYNYICNNYSIAVTAQNYINQYQELLEKKKK